MIDAMMTTKKLVKIALLLTMTVLAITGCKKKTAPQDSVFQHTPENTFKKIQEVRLQLTEAVEKKDLKYVHDSMFYFRGLLQALSSGLKGEQKQRVDEVLAELTVISEEIDNSAGRGNQAATEANLQKLINKLKGLETEFKPPARK